MTEHEAPSTEAQPEPAPEGTSTEPVPTAPAERLPVRLWALTLRYGALIRTGLLVVGLLAVWAVIVAWWADTSDYGEPLFDAARVFITFVALCLSAMWVASLKLARLRYALRPLEAGVVVGAIVLGIIVLFTAGAEVDELGDAAAIATVVGFLTALVVACVERLTTDESTALRWGAGVMVAAVVLGGLLPAFADRLTRGDEGLVATVASGGTNDVPVLARVQPDGGFRIDPMRDVLAADYGIADMGTGAATGSATPTAIGPDGAPIDPATGVALVVPGAAADPPAELPSDPLMASPPIKDSAKAIVRVDNSVDVELPAFTMTKTALRVQVRRGACGTIEAADAKPVDAWTVRDGSGPGTRVGSFQLDDIDEDGLYLVVGSGRAMANTACQQLVSERGVQLARADGAAFASECIKHARLTSAQVQALLPESFQDPDCAERFRSLTELANQPIDRTERIAGVAGCLNERAVPAKIIPLDETYAALAVEWTYDEDHVQAGFECGYDGSSTLIPSVEEAEVAEPVVSSGASIEADLPTPTPGVASPVVVPTAP